MEPRNFVLTLAVAVVAFAVLQPVSGADITLEKASEFCQTATAGSILRGAAAAAYNTSVDNIKSVNLHDKDSSTGLPTDVSVDFANGTNRVLDWLHVLLHVVDVCGETCKATRTNMDLIIRDDNERPANLVGSIRPDVRVPHGIVTEVNNTPVAERTLDGTNYFGSFYNYGLPGILIVLAIDLLTTVLLNRVWGPDGLETQELFGRFFASLLTAVSCLCCKSRWSFSFAQWAAETREKCAQVLAGLIGMRQTIAVYEKMLHPATVDQAEGGNDETVDDEFAPKLRVEEDGSEVLVLRVPGEMSGVEKSVLLLLADSLCQTAADVHKKIVQGIEQKNAADDAKRSYSIVARNLEQEALRRQADLEGIPSSKIGMPKAPTPARSSAARSTHEAAILIESETDGTGVPLPVSSPSSTGLPTTAPGSPASKTATTERPASQGETAAATDQPISASGTGTVRKDTSKRSRSKTPEKKRRRRRSGNGATDSS